MFSLRVEETVGLRVRADDYLRKLAEQCNIDVKFQAKVAETDRHVMRREEIRLRTPDVEIEVTKLSVAKITNHHSSVEGI